jgi:hypothetical protein
MRFPLRTALILLPLAASSAALARDPTPDRALAGRVPGHPVPCIHQSFIEGSEMYSSGSIVYRMRDGTYYVNTPAPKCDGMRETSAIVSHTFGGNLCAGDIVHIVDLPMHMDYGGCGLGNFTPYIKAK